MQEKEEQLNRVQETIETNRKSLEKLQQQLEKKAKEMQEEASNKQAERNEGKKRENSRKPPQSALPSSSSSSKPTIRFSLIAPNSKLENNQQTVIASPTTLCSKIFELAQSISGAYLTNIVLIGDNLEFHLRYPDNNNDPIYNFVQEGVVLQVIDRKNWVGKIRVKTYLSSHDLCQVDCSSSTTYGELKNRIQKMAKLTKNQIDSLRRLGGEMEGSKTLAELGMYPGDYVFVD